MALAVAIGGVGYAAIPDGGGVIHGCYATATGNLRVIDAPTQACAANETALSWNQQGSKGDAGPPGPPGADAVTGVRVVSKVTRGANRDPKGLHVFCPTVPGPSPRKAWTALGGGVSVFDEGGSPWVFTKDSYPIVLDHGRGKPMQPVGWQASAASFSPGASSATPRFRLRVWVICIPPPGVSPTQADGKAASS